MVPCPVPIGDQTVSRMDIGSAGTKAFISPLFPIRVEERRNALWALEHRCLLGRAPGGVSAIIHSTCSDYLSRWRFGS